MADLGSNLPVPIELPKETKSMKLLWVESQIKEKEAKILSTRRVLEGEELLLTTFRVKYEQLKNSRDA